MKDFEEIREAAFGRARFNQQLKKKGIDTNKMHSTNVKDAAAAKRRSKDAAKDHKNFKAKYPHIKFDEEAVTEDEFVPHMMYNPKTGKGYKAETEKDHIQMKKMGYSHEAPEVKEAKGEDGKGHYRATDTGAGMTQKGVDAVNKKTGGNLQTAVTGNPKAGSKEAGRRKSFCARMGGMKGPMKDDDGKPTRKAQSLKRWKC